MSIIADTASIGGFIGACLVDTDTGLMLASVPFRMTSPQGELHFPRQTGGPP